MNSNPAWKAAAANKARYDEAELRRHMARLTALLAQFAADPTLRCGEAEML